MSILNETDPNRVRSLLRIGANVNEVNEYGENALFKEPGNNPEIVLLLIDAGIKINKVNMGGQNALFRIKNPESVRLLLNKGINVEQFDNDRNTALFNADNTDILRLLLSTQLRKYVNHRNTHGETAIFNDKLDLDGVKMLIEAGANIYHQTVRKATLLFTVKNPEVLRYLLSEDFSLKSLINHLDDGEENALFNRFSKKSPEILQILIDNGIDVHQKNISGESALFVNDVDSLRVLLNTSLKNDINDTTYSGSNALFNAGLEIEALKLLIKSGININHIDHSGRNVLFEYVNYINTKSENIKILLNAGVATDVITTGGQNLISIMYNNLDAIKKLINLGIPINLLNGNGKNNLYAFDNVDILVYFVENGIDISTFEIPGDIDNSQSSHFRFLDVLLDNGYNINNIKARNEISVIPKLFSRRPPYRTGSSRIDEYLKENGHSFYFREVSKDYSSQDVIDLFTYKPKYFMLRFAYICRYHPDSVPVNFILSQGHSRANAILWYNNIFPTVNFPLIEESFILDELHKTLLVAKLVAISEEDEESNISEKIPFVVPLENLEQLSDYYQNLLNNIIVAPLIFQLYFHPITQNRLVLKETASANKDLTKHFLFPSGDAIVPSGDEYYDYIYNSAHKLFSYLTVDEILSLIKIDLRTLFLYRLRHNHRDTRTLEQILRDEYNGKRVSELLQEKYGSDKVNNEVLWKLLFEPDV
jgi:ankyrin repeat protein